MQRDFTGGEWTGRTPPISRNREKSREREHGSRTERRGSRAGEGGAQAKLQESDGTIRSLKEREDIAERNNPEQYSERVGGTNKENSSSSEGDDAAGWAAGRRVNKQRRGFLAL